MEKYMNENKRYILHCVAKQSPHGWIAYSLRSFEVGCKVTYERDISNECDVSTKEKAIEWFTSVVNNLSENPDHWSKHCKISWFDPTKHFTHTDDGYLYTEDGKPTGKLVVFVEYIGDKARIWEGGEQYLIDPSLISPLNIYKLWA